MRALVLEQPGRPPVLAVKHLPTPVPGPHEVLVEVAACGFCHHDLLVMAGVLRRGVKPGVVLGHEIAGVVVDAGAAVTGFRRGDHVVSLLTDACGECDRCRSGREHRCLHGTGIGHGKDGGFAEYVAMSEFSLVGIPPELDLVKASLLACPMGVALRAAESVARTGPGDITVVTGAGGGLGIHALQIASALGSRVLAVTTSPDKLGRFAPLGAEEILHSDELDFSELVLALTEDRGADVVLDTVGSALFESSWRSLAQFGRLVLLGEVTGRPVELNLAEVIFRDAQVLGSSGVSRCEVARIAEMVSLGSVTPILTDTLPLEEAGVAFDLLVRKQVLGRLALTAQ